MRIAARYLTAFLGSLLVLPAGHCPAGEAPVPKTFGWRGNWTGLYPDASPPLRWGRIAEGAVAGMSCQAAKPALSTARAAQPVQNGLIRDWLVLGPLPVDDSVQDFNRPQVPDESALEPEEGGRAGGLVWQRLELKKLPDYERWGTTELDWIDLTEVFDYKPNQIGYAHTYLHCERAGRVGVVVDHAHGMKAWLNGKVVYTNADRGVGLGSYVGISRQKQDLVNFHSPRFEIELGRGWNRLLLKLSTYNRRGWRSQEFAMRLIDLEPVAYAEENLVWVTELPERSNAVPIVVGDRVFVTAEPDELLCLDKSTGKILWRRINDFYEATPPDYRAARPVFAEKIDPLAERLRKTTDGEEALALRREIRDLLVETDKDKYNIKWDGHLASHFGIVGFTTTPVSDGRCIYVFCGQGVVACYDFDGNRKWIRRLEADEIRYSCSPALSGGKLVVIFGGMHALDAATGAVAWRQPEIGSIASLIPGRIRGTDVVSNRRGQLFRVTDGKLLWDNPHTQESDAGWAAPVILDDVMYVLWHGIGPVIVADFSEAAGEAWEPKLRVVDVAADHRRPNGEWLDRPSAGSPLIHEGIYYGIDQYGVFYAVDLASGETLYKQDVGFDELHHYNAIGVGAGATLGGKHIYVLDNQGVCVVLEPGREFRQVAVNRIETVIQRQWPVPPQEILSNGAPVFDGDRLYLRGEKYLYCIGNTHGR